MRSLLCLCSSALKPPRKKRRRKKPKGRRGSLAAGNPPFQPAAQSSREGVPKPSRDSCWIFPCPPRTEPRAAAQTELTASERENKPASQESHRPPRHFRLERIKKVMKGQKSEGPEVEEEPVREGSATGVVKPEYRTDRPGRSESQEGKGEPCKEMERCWEAQWQQFLKTLQSHHSAWRSPQLSENTPWDNTNAFLASFEQVAKACLWPRGEWAARVLPALSGEAEQAFGSLEARDQEDYRKVKAAILRGEALRVEMQCQHFRQFCCQEVEDPRRIHSQVQELCCQWLKPERHSMAQILELLILEQFLASLPPDLQGWIRAGGPDTCSQAVALAEDFLMGQQEAKTRKWQEPLKEEREDSLDAEEEPLEAAKRQIYKEARQNGSMCRAAKLNAQVTPLHCFFLKDKKWLKLV